MSARRLVGTLLTILTLVCLVAGCQRKCQAPPAEPLKSPVGQRFRLVETTNPELSKNLSRSTFLIFEFGANYQGNVFKVVNNDQFEQPELSFTYNVDFDQKILRVKYSKPAPQEDIFNSDTPQQQPTQAGPVVEYGYSIGRDLELTQSSTGYYYRSVPFTGVVDPFDNCSGF